MTRSKTAVYWMAEGEALVRGTLDPVQALGIAMAGTDEGGWNWEDEFSERPDEHNTDRYIAAHAADTAAFCHGRLKPQNHRAGWFRKNVQAPGGDYTWMLGEPEGPGPGNFRGVLFD